MLAVRLLPSASLALAPRLHGLAVVGVTPAGPAAYVLKRCSINTWGRILVFSCVQGGGRRAGRTLGMQMPYRGQAPAVKLFDR